MQTKKRKKYYKTTTINLKNQDNWFRFKGLCHLLGKSVSEVLDELIDKYIQENKSKILG